MGKRKAGWAIAVRSLHSIFGGLGGLCVKNGDLRGLWVTRSPTLDAWARVAEFPEVRYHVDIMRKEMRGMRKVWVAQEVSWQVWGTVSA